MPKIYIYQFSVGWQIWDSKLSKLFRTSNIICLTPSVWVDPVSYASGTRIHLSTLFF